MELSDYFAAARGAQAELARALGIPQSLPSSWAADDAKKRRPVPLEHCPRIERATDGAVTCEELRPQEPWRRIPDACWPNPNGRPVLDFATAKPAAAAHA